MAAGNDAKFNLIERFIKAAGTDYAGSEDNKKFYFWSTENGQPKQVCITMTCPKTAFVDANGSTPLAAKPRVLDFSEGSYPTTATTLEPVEQEPIKMDAKEEAVLARLMEELGL